MRYLFVINPVAGGNDQSALKKDIKKKFTNHQTTIYETTKSNDIANIEVLIEEEKPESCIICGGDGTINMLTPTLLKYDLTLGIVPAGSANGLATEYGIDLDNALDVILEANAGQLDVIKVNDHYMLHLADFGLNASLIKRYESENRHGFFGYVISALKELPVVSQNDFNVRLKVSTNTYEYRTKSLIIANARSYGTGFVVNPKGIKDDGLVELCILKDISTQDILKKLFLEENDHDPTTNESPLYYYHSVKEAIIECPKPVIFQSDGEYLGEITELNVSVHPEQIRIYTKPSL